MAEVSYEDEFPNVTSSIGYKTLSSFKAQEKNLNRTLSRSLSRKASLTRSTSLSSPASLLTARGSRRFGPGPKLSAEFQDKCAENNFSGQWVKDNLHFASVSELLPGTKNGVALVPTDERQPLFHIQLKAAVEHEFPVALATLGVKAGTRLGLVLPNGPEMAVCVIGCTISITCAPISAQNTVEEVVSELTNVRAKAVIISASEDGNPSELALKLRDAGLIVIELIPSETTSGLFTLRLAFSTSSTYTLTGFPPSIRDARLQSTKEKVKLPPLRKEDIGLVLHTSGTSGKKKVVPYSVETLVIGAALVIASWELKEDDIGLNMMPLFHVGGIVRNLLAPILSGGATIPCKAFDAAQFWELAEDNGATWYYAAPTMHHMILEEGKSRRENSHNIRMICNAAGGLLPALAKDLQYRFAGATVLPSYGMTECMPIASPPSDYTLDRPGTSGKIVGPELQISDGSCAPLPAGTVGYICVKGPPCFTGYEGNREATEESMFPGGWFNTGDMGYLDNDGYLFITGRSKEVINRGGEIISPFEIEQAIIQHPGIKETIAFSVHHDVLQEAVGVVLVSEPGFPRIDLPELHKFLGESLHPAKWPIVILYMDGVPTSSNNKVQRVKMAERTKLGPVDDSLPPISRLYEAKCPAKGAPLSEPILVHPVNVQAELEAATEEILKRTGKSRLADAGLALTKAGTVAYVLPKKNSKSWTDDESTALLEKLGNSLSAYISPKFVLPVLDGSLEKLPRTSDGALNLSVLPLPKVEKGTLSTPAELGVAHAWGEILDLPATEFGPESDFFHMGGSSLAAGRMVAILRKKFGVSLTAGAVFQHRTVGEFAEMLTGLLDAKKAAAQEGEYFGGPPGEFSVDSGEMDSGFGDLLMDNEYDVAACSPKSSTSFPALVLQLLPLVIFYPISRISLWFLFTLYLSLIRQQWNDWGIGYGAGGYNVASGLPELLLAIFSVKITADIVLPICGILCKWILIGKYKAGRYPLWGHYYLRWFLVRQILRISHMGMFTWFKGGNIWYFRLLGAKIGRNVLLDIHAKLGEYDLITVGDNTWIDNASIRPFCLDRGTMLLREIRIGDDCVICQKTAIAPGTRMPDGTALPPNSSSYEMMDADSKYRNFCRVGFPGPNWQWKFFVGYPILVFGTIAKFLPWVAGLFLYVNLPAFLHALTQAEIIIWFGSPARLPIFCFLKVLRDCFCPFTYLIYVILVKRFLVGRFKAGRRERSQWNLMRSWLMKNLMPGRDFGGVAGLVGPNFGVISFIYRLFGAKVGKHVYWPGSGVYIEELDLLEVGDHVVFGSRSEILCTDAVDSAPVKLGDGCMVADRCVLLPGVTVGKGVTLGSGTLAGKGVTFPPGSTWVGSSRGNATLWDLGNAKVAESAPSETPYGRAMRGEASYRVVPIWAHALLSFFICLLISSFHSMPIVIVLALTVKLGTPWLNSPASSKDLATIYGIMLALAIFSVVLVAFLSMVIVISMKWIIIGRRKEGSYDWDKSSYNQRWQIMRRIELFRSRGIGGHGVLDFLTGSAYLVWYFRAMGAKIGRNVCLYPNSGDPMMTEPELVTLEDEVAVDDASLVAHINTKGVFSLNRLNVGRGATLRSHSRLLSGANMEEHSMLLEHTLVLSGDSVDAHTIWQGWPARMVAAPPPPPNDGVQLFAGH